MDGDKESTRFVLARHGQTEWNRLGKQQGRLNPKLNEQGRVDMAEHAEQLRDLGITRIVSSPLRRARETACIFNEVLEVPIQNDRRLMECSYGFLEGRTIEEIGRIYGDRVPPVWKHWDIGPYDLSEWNGETREQVLTRMLLVLDTLHRKHTGEVILIVSHGRALWTLLGHLKGPEEAEKLQQGQHYVLR